MPVALRFLPAVLAVALWACDAAPGPGQTVARPTLASVAVTPSSAALTTADPTASVPLAVEGTLGGDAAATVRVLVRYAEADTLVAEVEAEVQPGTFRVEAPLVLPRGAVGDYAVTVATEGADGRAGDQAASVFRFSADNLGPPSVTVADGGTVDRPNGNATATVDLVASVTDPDGRENIAVVIVQIPEADGGGVIGRLFDDGDGADDDADDGRYSGGIVVTSDFTPGAYALEVVAVDRAGEASAPAPFTFTVR